LISLIVIVELVFMKQNKIVQIILSFIGVLIIILIAGKIFLSIQFTKEVKRLYSYPNIICKNRFNYSQLTNLPDPVQNYFKHVLKEGQPYINYIRLLHDGEFKTGEGKDWVNIKGEQYYTTQKPGFIWKGKTLLFTARDMYVADKGNLVVSLFSVFDVVNGHGEKYDQGELLRWLGESVWFPTNLLPNKNLQWEPIDNLSAKLTFKYNGINLFYIVKFNNAGEITQLETKRYMGEKDLETWIGKLSNYTKINDVLVPTNIEAIYKLKKEDYSYAKFHVKMIEYDKPLRF